MMQSLVLLLLWTATPTAHAQSLRVIEFILTPQFGTTPTTPSSSSTLLPPWVCTDETALATQIAAETCWNDGAVRGSRATCASGDDPTAVTVSVDLTYAECLSTGTILLRGGIVQAGEVSALEALETDACLRTTLATQCVTYFAPALPNLVSVVLVTTPSTTTSSTGSMIPPPSPPSATSNDGDANDGEEPEMTPPPVKVPDVTAVPIEKTTLSRSIAPVMPPTASPTVSTVAPTITTTVFPTEVPVSLIVVAPTAVPTTAATNVPTGSENEVPPPTLTPVPGISEASAFPTNLPFQDTPFPTPNDEITAAPALANTINSTFGGGVDNNANNGTAAAVPIVSNDPNRGVSIESGGNDSGNRTLYKGIVSGFAGVLGLGMLVYAAMLLRKKQNPSESSHPNKKGATLGASAVVVDTTCNNLSEHDDTMDTLELGTSLLQTKKNGRTKRTSARVVAVTPSPRQGGDASDVESRRSGSNNNQSAATSSIDAASATVDHFGAARVHEVNPPSRRPSRAVSSAAGGSSIPEHDELSSSCSSFDLNDSDGEESSMYESEGGDDTLTLDDVDFDMQPTFDASTGAALRPYPHSKANSEVSSLSSAQFETGGKGTAEGARPADCDKAETNSSRQFMEWLNKSPLIPAAAKASRTTVAAAVKSKSAVDPPPRSAPATTLPTTIVASRPSVGNSNSNSSNHSSRSGTPSSK